MDHASGDHIPGSPEAASPEKIPAEISAQVRTLLHDMSNALEIVVQAEYLISTVADNPETTKEWLGLLHRGTEQALRLNKALREYVRAHC